MIDIFAPDYQIKRVTELGKKAVEEAEKATPEENMKYLRDHGIIDENGNYTPDYEVLKYIGRDK